MKKYITIHRLWLGAILALSLVALLAAYASWVWYGQSICGDSKPFEERSTQHVSCVNLYLESLFAPFYAAFLLKSLALSSLIMLFFSARAFRMWLVFAALTMVIGVAFIVTTPVNAKPFSKTVLSDWAGAILFGGTIIIALGVSAYEWMRKRADISAGAPSSQQ